MKKIGILSLQGSVEEHEQMLHKFSCAAPVRVKTEDALSFIDGIILPGGESTTIIKLLHTFELWHPLREKIKLGLPVWGTCAGLILLAKEVIDGSTCLALMDIAARRNAFGRQTESFHTEAVFPAIGKKQLPMTFIRAPWIERAGDHVDILCRLDTPEKQIVAAREKNMLVTSFHPELTDDLSFHEYFLSMC